MIALALLSLSVSCLSIPHTLRKMLGTQIQKDAISQFLTSDIVSRTLNNPLGYCMVQWLIASTEVVHFLFSKCFLCVHCVIFYYSLFNPTPPEKNRIVLEVLKCFRFENLEL